MSKLEELINEYCPDGVEYKELGNLGGFFGGITGKSKEDFKDGNAVYISYKNVYDNPAVNVALNDRVRIAENEKQRTLKKGDVIFTGSSETPDECGISSVVTVDLEEKIYLNSFCFFFRFDNQDLILPDFSKHLFRSHYLRYQIGRTASGVTRFNVSKKKMEKVLIPVPPLEVQREIVRILDNFTELTSELTSELTARKKQYEYYRDDLMKCDGSGTTNIDSLVNKYCPDGVEYRSIDELFITKNGYTPSKKKKEYWEDGQIPWFRMEDIRENGNILFDSIQHVTRKAVKGELFPANSIIVATSATIGEHALLGVESLANQRFTYLILKNEWKEFFEIKFLYYYCYKLDEWCSSHLNQGNFASVDMKQFKKFKFPLLPLEIQRVLIRILDNFNKLCSDIESGLPAEIEARQKQYEYYRDKLLTFKEKKQ